MRITPHTPEEEKIPDGESFVLTQKLIEACRTSMGGFTSATMRAFGITRETWTHGWIKRIVGTTLTREQYQRAFTGRFLYNTKALKTTQPNQMQMFSWHTTWQVILWGHEISKRNMGWYRLGMQRFSSRRVAEIPARGWAWNAIWDEAFQSGNDGWQTCPMLHRRQVILWGHEI